MKKKIIKPAEKASPTKWKKIQERASELAMNHGKRPDEVGKQEMQRAKRELLRLQTPH